MNQVPWYDTIEGKEAILKHLNEHFSFLPDGTCIPREEYKCQKQNASKTLEKSE